MGSSAAQLLNVKININSGARPTMRIPWVLLVLALSSLRAATVSAAEVAHLPEPIEADETRRAIDARWSIDREHGRLQTTVAAFTAGDQLARSTALGYAAAATITLAGASREAACNLHDGTCAGAFAVGLELHGVLGDSVDSLDPAAQSHYLAKIVSLPLGAAAMLHAQLAVGLLDRELLGHLLVAWEF
jgi:hypothetical protein